MFQKAILLSFVYPFLIRYSESITSLGPEVSAALLTKVPLKRLGEIFRLIMDNILIGLVSFLMSLTIFLIVAFAIPPSLSKLSTPYMYSSSSSVYSFDLTIALNIFVNFPSWLLPFD